MIWSSRKMRVRDNVLVMTSSLSVISAVHVQQIALRWNDFIPWFLFKIVKKEDCVRNYKKPKTFNITNHSAFHILSYRTNQPLYRCGERADKEMTGTIANLMANRLSAKKGATLIPVYVSGRTNVFFSFVTCSAGRDPACFSDFSKPPFIT